MNGIKASAFFAGVIGCVLMDGAMAQSLSIYPEPFSYAGRLVDQESTLSYNNARYYNPQMSRFTSWDSVDLLNRYAYADGNPTNKTDPSGHSAIDVAKNLGLSVIPGYNDYLAIKDGINHQYNMQFYSALAFSVVEAVGAGVTWYRWRRSAKEALADDEDVAGDMSNNNDDDQPGSHAADQPPVYRHSDAKRRGSVEPSDEENPGAADFSDSEKFEEINHYPGDKEYDSRKQELANSATHEEYQIADLRSNKVNLNDGDEDDTHQQILDFINQGGDNNGTVTYFTLRDNREFVRDDRVQHLRLLYVPS